MFARNYCAVDSALKMEKQRFACFRIFSVFETRFFVIFERSVCEIIRLFRKYAFIARMLDVLADDVREKESVVRDLRPYAERGRVPPVHHIAFDILPFRAKQNMLSDAFGIAPQQCEAVL